MAPLEKRAWCIDLEHLIDGLRAKPRALLHCRYQRHLFPDQFWWVFWQQLLACGDRHGAARLFTERSGVGRRPLVEALYVAVRVRHMVQPISKGDVFCVEKIMPCRKWHRDLEQSSRDKGNHHHDELSLDVIW